MHKDSCIYVAGHRGLVGSAIVKNLKELGYTNIVTKSKEDLNLIDKEATENFFNETKPEYVFDAAARVGGIYANDTYSAEFIYQNLSIQNNLINSAYIFGVKKFLFMGSVCIYPKFCPLPIREEYLLTGHLEPTNEAYAIAKIAGIKMCQAYSKQYGFKTVSVMPCNLYGPNDNFDENNSHVVPAMIGKFLRNKDEVIFWGDGSPQREFLYSYDMARACIFLMDSELERGELVNASAGENISIKELADIVADLVDYKGKIIWDKRKPNGTPNRPVDSEKMYALGWKPKFSLKEGLRSTIDWYKANKT